MSSDDHAPAGPDAPAHPGAERTGLRSLALDLTPLRASPQFRLLWAGQGVSFFGSQMTYVAIPVQVFLLTGSTLAVGLIGLCELVALLLSAFVGGAVADAWDRRRMIRIAEIGLLTVSALLLLNATLDRPRVWPLFLLSAFAAAFDGLQRPSLEALHARLVPKELQPAAAALRSATGSLAALGGPALAGVLIGYVGVPVVYAVDVVSFAASLTALTLMAATPPRADADRPSLQAVREGLRYARSQPVLMGTYIADFNAMVFGMPRALFPALAVTRYGGTGVVGLLYAAPYAGSLLATATSGWTRRVHRHGQAIIWAVAVWGLAITAFGFASSLPVALVALAVAGAADMVSGLFRMTVWNQTIPDHLRGRLASIEMVNYASGPLLGDAEAGVVARLTSLQTSVVSGGLLCLAGLVGVVAFLPEFVRYDARQAQRPEQAG
ncbi:MAG TPA: MFS transporter [Mycobacteriales bacterium]|nr:MFS transporter [Mycobacteriales bacterium]